LGERQSRATIGLEGYLPQFPHFLKVGGEYIFLTIRKSIMKTIFTSPRTPPPKKVNWHYDTYFIEQLKRTKADREKKTPRGRPDL
jgi:hypothetical protein